MVRLANFRLRRRFAHAERAVQVFPVLRTAARGHAMPPSVAGAAVAAVTPVEAVVETARKEVILITAEAVVAVAPTAVEVMLPLSLPPLALLSAPHVFTRALFMLFLQRLILRHLQRSPHIRGGGLVEVCSSEILLKGLHARGIPLQAHQCARLAQQHLLVAVVGERRRVAVLHHALPRRVDREAGRAVAVQDRERPPAAARPLRLEPHGRAVQTDGTADLVVAIQSVRVLLQLARHAQVLDLLLRPKRQRPRASRLGVREVQEASQKPLDQRFAAGAAAR